jgi:hypothetical protein
MAVFTADRKLGKCWIPVETVLFLDSVGAPAVTNNAGCKKWPIESNGTGFEPWREVPFIWPGVVREWRLKQRTLAANRKTLAVSPGPNDIFQPMTRPVCFLVIAIQLVLSLVKMRPLPVHLKVPSGTGLKNRAWI